MQKRSAGTKKMKKPYLKGLRGNRFSGMKYTPKPWSLGTQWEGGGSRGAMRTREKCMTDAQFAGGGLSTRTMTTVSPSCNSLKTRRHPLLLGKWLCTCELGVNGGGENRSKRNPVGCGWAEKGNSMSRRMQLRQSVSSLLIARRSFPSNNSVFCLHKDRDP